MASDQPRKPRRHKKPSFRKTILIGTAWDFFKSTASTRVGTFVEHGVTVGVGAIGVQWVDDSAGIIAGKFAGAAAGRALDQTVIYAQHLRKPYSPKHKSKPNGGDGGIADVKRELMAAQQVAANAVQVIATVHETIEKVELLISSITHGTNHPDIANSLVSLTEARAQLDNATAEIASSRTAISDYTAAL